MSGFLKKSLAQHKVFIPQEEESLQISRLLFDEQSMLPPRENVEAFFRKEERSHAVPQQEVK